RVTGSDPCAVEGTGKGRTVCCEPLIWGDGWARSHCPTASHWVGSSLPGDDPAVADQDPLLQGDHCQLLHVRQLWLEQHRDPVRRPHPGSGDPLHLGRSHQAALTTIEGLIDRAVAGLEQDQPVRRVKSGGAIETLGTRIVLRVLDPSDMTRDVLKSETCSVEIPELEFELGMGALGGKFTTLEGLLKDIQDLVERNPFTLGDSSAPGRGEKIQEFVRKLHQVIDGQLKINFILDDPAGNSYLQNVYAPEADPEMKVEQYERTFEQNEELGLNDMKTEGYEAGLASER
uniref:ZPR1 zinc finger n=1 Tax=Sphenodon punctatus TaxID=8508 RepID=A0A8D0GM54_SPHPU